MSNFPIYIEYTLYSSGERKSNISCIYIRKTYTTILAKYKKRENPIYINLKGIIYIGELYIICGKT